MKEALVQPDLSVEVVDSPIPTPTPDQLIIKVVVTSTNPADWKGMSNQPKNPGKDIAGTVHSVGSDIFEFKPGDRVAALNHFGAYAEYAMAYGLSTFHLPANISFEEAATFPLPFTTAVIGMYYHLRLPPPYNPTLKDTPLVIYGAASAVGAFAVKMALTSNVHPIIAVAGRGIPLVTSLLDSSKGDIVLDYRDGPENLVSSIRKHAAKLEYAFDAISEPASIDVLTKVLDQQSGKLAVVAKPNNGAELYKTGIELGRVSAPKIFKGVDPESVEGKAGLKIGHREFAWTMFRWLATAIAQGHMTPHPYEVVPGGLDGVEKGLADVKKGVNSGVKYVYRIAETKGVGEEQASL